jgi:hypothetical protein
MIINGDEMRFNSFVTFMGAFWLFIIFLAYQGDLSFSFKIRLFVLPPRDKKPGKDRRISSEKQATHPAFSDMPSLEA